MKNVIISSSVALLVSIGLTGCAGGYEPVPNMTKLDAKFLDKKWDGKKIPKDDVCGIFGGKGETPKIMVNNIPKGANAIIMEVNDLGYAPLSRNGGHGKIGFWIEKNSSTAILIPVPEDKAKNLPAGTFIERASLSKGKYASNGYLAPCSGGRNHLYVADIKAVYKAKTDDEKSMLLGETNIQFGRY